MDSSPQVLKLTDELLEYARAVALSEAPKYCGPRVSYDDVAQEAIVQLLRNPPRFDPSRGATPKTLIFIVVQRAVAKAAQRETKQARSFRQFPEPVEADDEEPPEHQVSEKRTVELTRSRWNLDDILQFIDDKDSRALCRLVIECKGNLSEAARRLNISEGTVRHRLKVLGPRLRAAGFDPYSTGGIS